MEGCEKKSNVTLWGCNTWSGTKACHILKSHILPYERAEVWWREKRILRLPVRWCRYFPWSRDPETRCNWLLDLHAALKAKSREARKYILPYSW